MLEAIDDFVLGGIERFSHFMQRTFGTRAADLERACLVAAVLFLLRDSSDILNGSVSWVGIAVNFLLVLSYVSRFTSSYERQREAERRALHGFMNPHKAMIHARLVALLLCCLILPFDSVRMDFWFECSILAYFFECCDDLPPGVSRVRKLLNSLTAKLVPVPT